jgi:MerR family transcriptional regulator, copper efflux regulator
MASLTIGQMARKAGVGIDTVRFYERQGLLAKPPRRASGYRDYSAESLRRLRRPAGTMQWHRAEEEE